MHQTLSCNLKLRHTQTIVLTQGGLSVNLSMNSGWGWEGWGRCMTMTKTLKTRKMVQCSKCRTVGIFHQNQIFANFASWFRWRKFYSVNFSLCINYIVDAATITVLVKNSYNTRVLALAKTFSHEIYPLYGI